MVVREVYWVICLCSKSGTVSSPSQTCISTWLGSWNMIKCFYIHPAVDRNKSYSSETASYQLIIDTGDTRLRIYDPPKVMYKPLDWSESHHLKAVRSQVTFPILACDVAAGDSHVAAVCWTGAVQLDQGSNFFDPAGCLGVPEFLRHILPKSPKTIWNYKT